MPTDRAHVRDFTRTMIMEGDVVHLRCLINGVEQNIRNATILSVEPREIKVTARNWPGTEVAVRCADYLWATPVNDTSTGINAMMVRDRGTSSI